MLTAQEKFNLAWRRAFNGQGKMSHNDEKYCLTSEVIPQHIKEKCPDVDHYLWMFFKEFHDEVGHPELINDLQMCYDFAEPEHWEYILKDIAEKHGLRIPGPAKMTA